MSETIQTTDRDDKHGHAAMLRVLQSRNEIRAYYNKIAKVYDLLAEHSEAPMRAAGLQLLAAQPGETVVEVGSGTGHSLVELARSVQPGGQVHGIDISEAMNALAGDVLKREGLDTTVRLWHHDATSLPFADDAIDALFMSFTLELFDTPEIPTILVECRRVLRPGGRLAIVSISKDNPSDVMVRTFEWTHRHFPNLLDCRPIYARRAVEAAGFEVVTGSVRHMWLPVEIVLARVPGFEGVSRAYSRPPASVSGIHVTSGTQGSRAGIVKGASESRPVFQFENIPATGRCGCVCLN